MNIDILEFVHFSRSGQQGDRLQPIDLVFSHTLLMVITIVFKRRAPVDRQPSDQMNR